MGQRRCTKAGMGKTRHAAWASPAGGPPGSWAWPCSARVALCSSRRLRAEAFESTPSVAHAACHAAAAAHKVTHRSFINFIITITSFSYIVVILEKYYIETRAGFKSQLLESWSPAGATIYCYGGCYGPACLYICCYFVLCYCIVLHLFDFIRGQKKGHSHCRHAQEMMEYTWSNHKPTGRTARCGGTLVLHTVPTSHSYSQPTMSYTPGKYINGCVLNSVMHATHNYKK